MACIDDSVSPQPMLLRSFCLILYACQFLVLPAQNWEARTKILASDSFEADLFGQSIAISGNYAIVGASVIEDDPDTHSVERYGVAYIFEKDPAGDWQQIQKIVPSKREPDNFFYQEVAMSGSYAMIGDLKNRVYVFERNDTGRWEEVSILSGENEGDLFGSSLDMEGELAVIGAKWQDFDPDGDGFRDNGGAAYIFRRKGKGKWIQIQKIVASDRANDVDFGAAVALEGKTILVGATREDILGANVFEHVTEVGAVYVFQRNVLGVWQETQKLIPSDQPRSIQFGSSIDISGGYCIVGAVGVDRPEAWSNISTNGTAYIFEQNAKGLWEETRILKPLDVRPTDRFGFSVRIDGNTAVVGAYGENRKDSITSDRDWFGAAYVYKQDLSGVWIEQQRIESPTQIAEDWFGRSIAMDCQHILIGAHLGIKPFYLNEPSFPGEVYVFGREQLRNSGMQTQSPLKIFPNPTPCELTLDIGDESQQLQIRIIDPLGRQTMPQIYQEGRLIRFSLRGPSGLYLIHVLPENGDPFTRKVIKGD